MRATFCNKYYESNFVDILSMFVEPCVFACWRSQPRILYRRHVHVSLLCFACV